MSETFTITGMPQAVPNVDSKVIRFTLTTTTGNVINCEAPFGVVSQVAGGLGTALMVLRMALSMQGAVEPVAAEPVQSIHFRKVLLTDDVVLEIVSQMGVPFLFQIPAQNAEETADRLKTEASKKTPKGSA